MISEQRLKDIEEIASKLNGLAMTEASSAMRELLAEVRNLRLKTTVTVELSAPLRESLDDLKQRVESGLKTVAEMRALHEVRIDGNTTALAEQAGRSPQNAVIAPLAYFLQSRGPAVPGGLVIEEDPEAPLGAPAHHPV